MYSQSLGPSFIEHPDGLMVEAPLESLCAGLETPVAPARPQQSKEAVVGMARVLDYPRSLGLAPLGVDVLEGRKPPSNGAFS